MSRQGSVWKFEGIKWEPQPSLRNIANGWAYFKLQSFLMGSEILHVGAPPNDVTKLRYLILIFLSVHQNRTAKLRLESWLWENGTLSYNSSIDLNLNYFSLIIPMGKSTKQGFIDRSNSLRKFNTS